MLHSVLDVVPVVLYELVAALLLAGSVWEPALAQLCTADKVETAGTLLVALNMACFLAVKFTKSHQRPYFSMRRFKSLYYH